MMCHQSLKCVRSKRTRVSQRGTGEYAKLLCPSGKAHANASQASVRIARPAALGLPTSPATLNYLGVWKLHFSSH